MDYKRSEESKGDNIIELGRAAGTHLSVSIRYKATAVIVNIIVSQVIIRPFRVLG